jgi:uncharacterized membrane protein
MRVFLLLCVLICVALLPIPVQGQQHATATSTLYHAEVVQAAPIRSQELPGLGMSQQVQMIRVRIESGARDGDVVAVQNDRTPLSVGDHAFIREHRADGDVRYSVAEVDRRGALAYALAIFAVAIVLLGGRQGVRALASLLMSIVAVVFVLLPLLLRGWPPVSVSIAVTALVLLVAIFVTHGVTRNAAIAYAGTLGAVCIAGALSLIAMAAANLTGLGADEAVLLNAVSESAIDVRGLLLAGILIGMVGVLDDIAITQVAVVSELRATGTHGARELFRRAMRVGREHVGALVNTLVLAYVGASLPLLLLLYEAQAPLAMVLSQEVIVTEVIRAILGSIGLIAAVPLTTFIAVRYARAASDTSAHHRAHIH